MDGWIVLSERDAKKIRAKRARITSRPEVAIHLKQSPPENYGKENQTTVAAFLPWRGSSVLNP